MKCLSCPYESAMDGNFVKHGKDVVLCQECSHKLVNAHYELPIIICQTCFFESRNDGLFVYKDTRKMDEPQCSTCFLKENPPVAEVAPIKQITCTLCEQTKYHAHVKIAGKDCCLECIGKAVQVANDIGLIEFYERLQTYRSFQ